MSKLTSQYSPNGHFSTETIHVFKCAPFDGELIFYILVKTVGYLLSNQKSKKFAKCAKPTEQVFHLAMKYSVYGKMYHCTWVSMVTWRGKLFT